MLLASVFAQVRLTIVLTALKEKADAIEKLSKYGFSDEELEKLRGAAAKDDREEILRDIEESGPKMQAKAKDLLSFFADRLKVYLRDRGARHDLVDAVFALEGQDDLVLIVKRVEALSDFLSTEDGANLLAGYKRATNILRIEEKKDGEGAFDAAPDGKLFELSEEKALAAAIEIAAKDAKAAVAKEDFAAAMSALAKLRAPVDAFFEKVTVNADDAAVRANRLKLLAQIRAGLHEVADFSKVEG